MASYNLFLSSAFATILLVLLIGATAANAERHKGIPHISPTPLIQQACTNAPDQEICLFALTSNPYGNRPGVDIHFLANVSLEAAIKKKAQVNIRITGLLNHFHPPVLQEKIRECEKLYADAEAKLKQALQGLQSAGGASSRDAAIALVQDASTAADKCEAGCESQWAEPKLLESRNLSFKGFCANAVHVLKQLPN